MMFCCQERIALAAKADELARARETEQKQTSEQLSKVTSELERVHDQSPNQH